MILLKLTKLQFDELYNGLLSSDDPATRKKCLTVYLRAKGYSREAIADIARVDVDTVTHHVKLYAEGGLQRLLENRYRRSESALAMHTETILAAFKKSPPHGQSSG